MKKVLALVIMAGLAQGLSSQQEPAQYKHLNRLPKDSRLRKECEMVNRALFIPGKTERMCDRIDDMIDTINVIYKASIKETGGVIEAERLLVDALNMIDTEVRQQEMLRIAKK